MQNLLKSKKALIYTVFGEFTTPTFYVLPKHFSGIIQRRFHYVFISNIFLGSIKNACILPSFSFDHLPVSTGLKMMIQFQEAKAWGKTNCSLLTNDKFITDTKTHIYNKVSRLLQEEVVVGQVRLSFWNIKSENLHKHLQKARIEREQLDCGWKLFKNKLESSYEDMRNRCECAERKWFGEKPKNCS